MSTGNFYSFYDYFIFTQPLSRNFGNDMIMREDVEIDLSNLETHDNVSDGYWSEERVISFCFLLLQNMKITVRIKCNTIIIWKEYPIAICYLLCFSLVRYSSPSSSRDSQKWSPLGHAPRENYSVTYCSHQASKCHTKSRLIHFHPSYHRFRRCTSRQTLTTHKHLSFHH